MTQLVFLLEESSAKIVLGRNQEAGIRLSENGWNPLNSASSFS